MHSCELWTKKEGVAQLERDDFEEERCVHITAHNKKKHALEIRATELTCNQTVYPHFQQ